jgi:hypothetical protein
MLLVLHRNYCFSYKDVGKKVLLSNCKIAKILTVITEAGRIHSVYGVISGFTDILSWDARGGSEQEDYNIVMILESEPNGTSAN